MGEQNQGQTRDKERERVFVGAGKNAWKAHRISLEAAGGCFSARGVGFGLRPEACRLESGVGSAPGPSGRRRGFYRCEGLSGPRR